MDELDRIFREADQAGVRLALAPEAVRAVRGDAVLFDAVQVPVVALSVVACIAGRRAGEPVHALGARVGHTLMTAFPAFTRIGRYLQWSIRVRSVTADAIGFLEQSGLITVAADEDRKTTLTDRGRDFVQRVRASSDAGVLLQLLASAAARTRNHDLRLL